VDAKRDSSMSQSHSLLACVLGLVVALLAGPGAAAASNTQPPIETGFTDVLNLSADLFQVLEAKDRERVSSKPVLLEKEAVPCVLSREVASDEKRPTVHFSAGMVDLMNYVSFLKAIQKVNKSYYSSSLDALAKVGPGQPVPLLSPVICPAKSQLDVSNEQMGYFNQIAGGLLSLEWAHHALGYYAKYHDKLNGNVAISSLLPAKEYQKALVMGANKALECGLGVDGLRAVMEMINNMQARPEWTVSILPREAKPSKIMRLLKAVEDRKLKPGDVEEE
jgi:hypothetical protein